jgi:hypothetical protein
LYVEGTIPGLSKESVATIVNNRVH